VIDDMILLDNKGQGATHTEAPREEVSEPEAEEKPAKSSKKKAEKEETPAASDEEDVMPDDIPF